MRCWCRPECIPDGRRRCGAHAEGPARPRLRRDGRGAASGTGRPAPVRRRAGAEGGRGGARRLVRPWNRNGRMGRRGRCRSGRQAQHPAGRRAADVARAAVRRDAGPGRSGGSWDRSCRCSRARPGEARSRSEAHRQDRGAPPSRSRRRGSAPSQARTTACMPYRPVPRPGSRPCGPCRPRRRRSGPSSR
jgi:hypothetical protein